MDLIQLQTNQKKSGSSFALFDAPFRPFFFMAGIYAVLLLFIWMGVYSGLWTFSNYYGLTAWHSHEILFGFSTAVMAGFLLTAVQHWTGIPTTSKTGTIFLSVLWLAGRIIPVATSFSMAGAIIDLLFLPFLTLFVAKPIFIKRQRINYIYPFILIGLSSANLLIHLQHLGITANTSTPGTYLAFNLTVLMIIIFGGRIIPMFTAGATKTVPRQWKFINSLGNWSVIGLTLSQFLSLGTNVTLFFTIIAAISNGIRLAGWYSPKIWKQPLIWVLQVGYAWLVIGFVMFIVNRLWTISPFLSLHALSVGWIGGVTLGMVARVSLGHTRRMLLPDRLTQIAFVLINCAAVVRVFIPLMFPAAYTNLVVFSALIWTICFTLLIVSFAPILVRSRPDGQTG